LGYYPTIGMHAEPLPSRRLDREIAPALIDSTQHIQQYLGQFHPSQGKSLAVIALGPNSLSPPGLTHHVRQQETDRLCVGMLVSRQAVRAARARRFAGSSVHIESGGAQRSAESTMSHPHDELPAQRAPGWQHLSHDPDGRTLCRQIQRRT
jgi:hypothetical protein